MASCGRGQVRGIASRAALYLQGSTGQSMENTKHVLRSTKENARQGFWNGSKPPFGYRTVEVEERGVRRS